MELPHLPTTPIIDHVICEQSLSEDVRLVAGRVQPHVGDAMSFGQACFAGLDEAEIVGGRGDVACAELDRKSVV